MLLYFALYMRDETGKFLPIRDWKLPTQVRVEAIDSWRTIINRWGLIPMGGRDVFPDAQLILLNMTSGEFHIYWEGVDDQGSP